MARLILHLVLWLLIVLPQGTAWAQVAFPHSSLVIESSDGAHHTFTVEVATTDEQLSQGLMFRDKMAADAGMLFDFGAPRSVAMWMKNTLIPLDMLFLDADGRVVGIAERTVPNSTITIAAPKPAKGVLELNGGTVSRLRLKLGDRVVHPIFAPR